MTMRTNRYFLLTLMIGITVFGDTSFCRGGDSQLELALQLGHSSCIHGVGLSGDGRRVATQGCDGGAIVWDMVTGFHLRRVPTGPNYTDPALDDSGNLLLVGDGKENAILWNVETGEQLHEFNGRPDALSGNGRRASIDLSKDYTERSEFRGKHAVYDLTTGKLIEMFQGTFGGLSSDGNRILIRTGKDTTVLWQVQPLKQLHAFSGSKTIISKNGARILSSSDTSPCTLWDAESGKKLRTFPGTAELLSGDGQKVVTSVADGSTKRKTTVWNATTGEKVREFAQHPDAVNQDGTRILLGHCQIGPLDFYDVSTGRRVFDLHTGKQGQKYDTTLTDDGKHLITGGNQTVVWSADTGKQIQVFGAAPLLNPNNDDSLVVLPEKNTSPSQWREVSVWDFHSHQLNHRYWPLEKELRWEEQFSRDGRVLVNYGTRRSTNGGFTSIPDGETEIDVWESNRSSPSHILKGHKGWISEVSSDRDSTRLISGGLDKTVIVWDLIRGKSLQTFSNHQHSISAVSISADGKWALSGDTAGTVHFWEVATGQVRQTFRTTTTRIGSLAISKDQKSIVAGTGEGDAILWDAQTGRKLRVIAAHNLGLERVTFINSGRCLLTQTGFSESRLWDLESGDELCKLFSLNKGNDWLVVTPDGLFDGSIQASKFLSYRIRGSLEFVPLERFQQRYYQPGLLAKLLAGERPRAKIDIGKLLPPKVVINSPQGSDLNSNRTKIDVQATAETRGDHPVTSLKLLVDGRPYRGQSAVVRFTTPVAGTVTGRWSIEVEPGQHTLKVLADTAYVQGASDEVVVRLLGGQPETPIELPTLYGLVIGVSKYPGARKLDYAAADAKALAEAYQKHSRPLFQKIEVKQILDEQATRKGIFEGLLWLREKMNQNAKNSFGVVFFAGHGETDQDGSLYFLPIDFEERNLAGSAIDADSLKKQLAGIPGRLMLILDACHSGQIGAGKTRGTGNLTDNLIRDLTAEENGLTVMCSTLGTELAQESHTHRHGMFTVAMLEGLAGQARKTTDGAVYLTSLDAYVVERVRELSQGEQHPVTSKPTTMRDFPVSKP